MKKNNIFLMLIVLPALFAACNSASKLFKKGDYYRATIEAVQNLRSKPDNVEAQQILVNAYALAKENSLRVINNSLSTNNSDKYDVVVKEYQDLNTLAENIYHSPAALKLVPQPQQFYSELDNAKNMAAEAAYNQGVTCLNRHTVDDARTALSYFTKVKNYVPNYRDIDQKLTQSKSEAILRVIVQRPRTNERYQVSADFFYENLVSEMNRTNQRKLVIFYTPEEAQNAGLKKPHQYIDLDFFDFSVGNMKESSREIDCKKDNVVVGSVVVDGVKHDAKSTVTAKLTIFSREITSGGILVMNISDTYSSKSLQKRSFQGSYVWKDEWATFRGDDRALTDQQKALCNRSKTQIPPDAQTLFVEFTKPIYTQAISAVRSFYSRML